MAIPKHADPRAHKFYEYNYVGPRHGDAGTSSSMDWDSMHSDLQPTAIITHDHSKPACGYCGHVALPIQHCISYNITGYTCCCVKAMDELDWRKTYSELLAKQADERKVLQLHAPVVDKAIIQRLMDSQHQATVKHLRERLPEPKLLVPYGISFDTPLSHFDKR
jgi:hypothetical protein